MLWYFENSGPMQCGNLRQPCRISESDRLSPWLHLAEVDGCRCFGPAATLFPAFSPRSASHAPLPTPPGSGASFCPLAVARGLKRAPVAPVSSPVVFAGWERTRNVMQFKGTKNYVATDDLKVAVNAAITLQRPLLVKGEPGTGKTVLALEVAKAREGAADRMAHQVDHQGAAGPLRVRRGEPPARQPARRRAASATSATTSARASCGRRSRWTSARCC